MIKIERYLFIFYVSQIIVIFILDKFLSDLDFGGLIGFIMKFGAFSIFSIILFIAIFAVLATHFCGYNYYPKKNFEPEDLVLTSSVIVTTFLLNDLLSVFDLVSKDVTIPFILTIVIGIPITFFIIYQITFLIAKSLYNL